ncbi:MAG: MaoC family dehydratase N-terminal domain-containing protein [Hyphomonadaceae bacterium]
MKTEDLEEHLTRLRGRIGRQSRAIETKIEAGAIQKFARIIGETNPLYFDEDYAKSTRFGGLIAPPTYPSCFVIDLVSELMSADLPLPRGLHSDDIVENNFPIRPGDVITASARFADVYQRQGRDGPMVFQAVDVTLVNQDGARVAVVRMVGVSF